MAGRTNDPLFVIGAEVHDLGTSARAGQGDCAVVEADEYDRSFLYLTPDVSVITNIEHDHPDIFPDMAAYRAAFAQYVSQTRPGGTVVVRADDPECAAAAVARPLSVRHETVGTDADAMWRSGPGRVFASASVLNAICVPSGDHAAALTAACPR